MGYVCLFFRQNDGDSLLREGENPIPQPFHNALWIRKKKPFRTNFFRQRLNPPFLNSQTGNAKPIAIITMESQFDRNLLHWKPFMIYCKRFWAFDLGWRIQLIVEIGIKEWNLRNIPFLWLRMKN